MAKHTDNVSDASVRGRSRALTVFAAALVAGGAVALGVNRLLELHLERARPQVESEPIFVSLRSLPSGAAVTVWDVGLREWPTAMVPAAAVRSIDSFDGLVTRHPLREGQPLLAVQLSLDPDAATRGTAPRTTLTSGATASTGDLWLPAETTPTATPARAPAVAGPRPPVTSSPQPTLPEPVPVGTPVNPQASPAVAITAASPAADTAATSLTVTGTAFVAAPIATSTDTDPPSVIAAIDPAAPTESVAPPATTVDPVPPTESPLHGTVVAATPATPAAVAGQGGVGGGMKPLLPEPWAPATLRTIIVPQRITLKSDDDAAAAVAAAVNFSGTRRGKAAETTSHVVTPASSAGPSATAPATRIASAPLTSPLRQPAAAADSRKASAGPPTTVRPATPLSRPRQPAPSRGFRLPSLFDWTK
ncbi:MAG: hypothetical protein EBR86_13945 [Planctomycetia bacterium]|nr:hypothetical protein [Planctomycetia bacterium]